MSYIWNQPNPEVEIWHCPEHGLKMARIGEDEYLVTDSGGGVTVIQHPMQWDSFSKMWVEENPLNSIADPFESPRIVQLGPYHFSGGGGPRGLMGQS